MCYKGFRGAHYSRDVNWESVLVKSNFLSEEGDIFEYFNINTSESEKTRLYLYTSDGKEILIASR